MDQVKSTLSQKHMLVQHLSFPVCCFIPLQACFPPEDHTIKILIHLKVEKLTEDNLYHKWSREAKWKSGTLELDYPPACWQSRLQN